MMTQGDVENGALVERIVHMVLQRLDRQLSAVTLTGGKPSNDELTLEIHDKVVSLRALEKKLEGVRRLVLAEGAIVTPSVRDEIKQRGITIEFMAGASRSGNLQSCHVTLVSADKSKSLWQTLEKLGQRTGMQILPFQANEDILLHELQMSITNNRGRVAWFSERPAGVVHRANRAAWLKAAWVVDVPSVCEAQQSIDANLYAIQPSRHSMSELQQLIELIMRL